MYWLMLYAHPRPNADDYGVIDAAWASCFVNGDDLRDAEARAREFLALAGWDTEELEEFQVVTRDEYENDPDNLAKFDQALIDGLVVTLHQWDVGAPDE